jgi:hypothetical protein
VPFDDRTSDSALAGRSLSEQLRDLEARLGAESAGDNDLSMPRVARMTKLPTHLGRPIGVSQPEGFPRIARLAIDPDERAVPAPPPSPGATFRRGATIVGVGLLLLATTAIVPPLFLRHPAPVATQTPVSDYRIVPLRTERFAQSAQDLSRAAPGIVSSSLPAEPVTPRASPDLTQPKPPRPRITLAVPANELARVDLPTMVTGMRPASAGSVVVIDGLPDGTRVSHGLPIARDSWTVASADVDSAVVFLPKNAPERVDVLIRVIAADSQELAANSLEIQVLRTTDVTAPAAIAPETTVALGTTQQTTAHFEPAAAEGQAAPDALVPPPLRKPSVPRAAKSPSWPTSTSGWTHTVQDADRPAAIERQPAPWSAFPQQ